MQDKRLLWLATLIAVAIVSCLGCLLIGYQLKAASQLKRALALAWEGDRYLWIAGFHGVVRWDVARQRVVHRSFWPFSIDHFLVTSEGQVWGYGDTRVWLFESGKWIEMNETWGLDNRPFKDIDASGNIIQTHDGSIWAATLSGYKRWNRETRRWEPTPIALPGSTLAQGPDGSLWFGLRQDGVLRLEGNKLTHWTVDDGLINDQIESILVVSDGTVWVGTDRGASHWNGHSWQEWRDLGYADPDGLVVHKFYETSDGTIWAATSEGVARWDGKEWMTYRFPYWAGIFTFLETGDGIFWAGSQDGLFRWTGSDWREYSAADGLDDGSYSRLVEGADGILYAATWDGIYQYIAELDRWKRFPDK